MTPSEKKEVVAALSKDFSESNAAFFIDYKGTSCQSFVQLRRDLRPVGAKFAVVKNKLARLSVGDVDAAGVAEMLKGPSGVIWAKEDPVSPAKVARDFAKSNESFSIKGGILDGKLISADEVEQLASMPSKEEVFAKLLALINAPATRLLQTINEPAAQLARFVAAWRDELEKKG